MKKKLLGFILIILARQIMYWRRGGENWNLKAREVMAYKKTIESYNKLIEKEISWVKFDRMTIDVSGHAIQRLFDCRQAIDQATIQLDVVHRNIMRLSIIHNLFFRWFLVVLKKHSPDYSFTLVGRKLVYWPYQPHLRELIIYRAAVLKACEEVLK